MNTESVQLSRIDFAKSGGLIPAIVQDARSARVLMLGYMNAEALVVTMETRRVTFWSRSRAQLWTKGEQSGHTLDLVALHVDCDSDTLLVLANPNGPTCHRGCVTCFDEIDGAQVRPASTPLFAELAELDALIGTRIRDRPPGSYTTKLAEAGIRRVAQKVGEEGVETALAAVAESEEALINEAADLIYHLSVALHLRQRSLADVMQKLRERRG